MVGVASFTQRPGRSGVVANYIRSRPDFLSSVSAKVLRWEMVPTWQRSLRSSVSSIAPMAWAAAVDMVGVLGSGLRCERPAGRPLLPRQRFSAPHRQRYRAAPPADSFCLRPTGGDAPAAAPVCRFGENRGGGSDAG